jgi:hypothetical protein
MMTSASPTIPHKRAPMGIPRTGGDGRLHVAEMWPGEHTTVYGRLVGIEWHEMTDDRPGPATAWTRPKTTSRDADDFCLRADGCDEGLVAH